MTLQPPEEAAPALLVLGSNMGDRLGHLRGAVEALALAGRIDAVSPVYESPPAGHIHQGPFLNLALRLMTASNYRPMTGFGMLIIILHHKLVYFGLHRQCDQLAGSVSY